MKNKKLKVTICLVVFVFSLAIVSVLYNNLSKNYTPEQLTATEDAKSDNPAPGFTVYDKNGEEVSLSDFKGKPVVVNFWATWCGPCKMELPAFENAFIKYKSDVEFLMINLDYGKNDDVERFLTEEKYSFPVYYDSDYSASIGYSVASIPLTVFVDERGEIVHTQIGAMHESRLFDYIESLLEE